MCPRITRIDANDYNDEAQITNDERSPNAQMTKGTQCIFRYSDLVIPSEFGIRHSSFRQMSFFDLFAFIRVIRGLIRI